MTHGMQLPLIAGLCSALFVALTAFYGVPWVLRRVRMYRMRNAVVRGRVLVLTYDDGPSQELTPQILDLLRSRGARATFFVMGRAARRHPEIVDRIVREGHAVGCHSDQHLNAWTSLPGAVRADIENGYNSLSRWIGADAIFRPPYGKMTALTWWWARRRGVPVVWWTLHSGDTHKVLPDAVQIAEAVKKDGGGIVLMHDCSRSGQRNDFVLKVTSALLDVAESESLHILPLTELCP